MMRFFVPNTWRLSFLYLTLPWLLYSCAPENTTPRKGVIQLSEAFSVVLDLIDHNGAPAPHTRFTDKPLLIYFGFTSCPDVCPAALGVMSATLNALGGDADKVHALFITVDPERDTPATLKMHLAFDPRILGLSGTVENLATTRAAMRVYAQKVDLPDSALGYTMDHQSMFFVVDRDGRPALALIDTLSPADIAHILHSFL